MRLHERDVNLFIYFVIRSLAAGAAVGRRCAGGQARAGGTHPTLPANGESRQTDRQTLACLSVYTP